MQQQQPQQWGRVKLTEVNPHLVCVLCHGYFIDATTMSECPHSFCRSCIILYLESKSYCPICEVQIHKTKPHLNLKPDKTLQDIVYKLVPGLFHSEMRRRREFYQKHPNRDMYLSPEARGVGIERIIYSPEDSISLSLEYYDQEREREEWAAARPGEQKPETAKPEKPGGENSSSSSSTTSSSTSTTNSASTKRYLQCPAVVTMRHLKKFIRMKYNLSQACTVELLYRRESLPDSYSLMDIAYIYTWKRNGPMRFYYRIHVPTTVTRVLPPVEPTVRVTELAVNGVNKEEKQERKPGTETESSSSSVESRVLLDAVGLKPRGGDKEDDDISLVVTTTVVPEEKKVDVTAGEEKVCQNNTTTTTARNETHEAANDVGGSSVLPGVKRPYEHDPLSVSLLLSLRNGHPKPVVTTAISTPIITTSTTTTMTATTSTPIVSSSVTNTAVVSTTTNTVAPTQDRRASAPSSVDTVVTSSATVNCSKPHTNGTAAPAVSESNTQQQPVINKQLSNYAVDNNSQRPAPSQMTFNGNRSSGGNTMAGKTPAVDKIPLSRMIQQRNVSSNGGIRNNGQLMDQIKREHQQTNGVQVTNGNSCPTSSSSGVFVTQENGRSKYTTSSSSSSQNKPLTVAEKVLKSAKYMPSAYTTPGIVRTQTKDANSNNNLLNQNNAQNNNNNSNNSISSTTGNNADKPVAHSTKAVNSDNGDKTELTTVRAVDQSPPQHRKEVNRLEQILKESLKRKCLSSCDKNNGGNSELKNSTLLTDKEQQQTGKKDGADNRINSNESTSQKTTTVQVENAKREEEIQRTTEGATLSGVAIKEAGARAESPSAASIQDHVASASPTPAVDTSTTSILKRKLNDPAYSRGLVSFNSSVSSHDQDNKKRRLVTPEVSIELTSKPNVSISSSAASTVTTASNSNNINKTNNSEVTDFSKLTKKFLESLQQMKKPNAMTTTNEFKFKDMDQLCASTVKIEKVPSVMMSPETVTHVNGDNGLVRPTTSVPEEAHKRKADTVEVTIHRVSDDRPSTSETQSLPLHPSPKKMPRLIEINAPPRPKLSAPLHHQDRKQQKTGLKMTTVRKEVPIGKEIPTLVRKDVNGALDLSSGSCTTTTTTTNKIKSGFQRPQTSSGKSPTMSTSSLAPLLAMTSFPMPEMKTTTSPPIRVPTLKQKTPLHLQPRPSSLSSSSPSPPAESRPSTADVFSAAAFQQFYRHQLEMHNRLLASQVSNNNNNSWRQDPVTAKKLEDWMRTVMTCGGLTPHHLMFPAQLSPESHRK